MLRFGGTHGLRSGHRLLPLVGPAAISSFRSQAAHNLRSSKTITIHVLVSHSHVTLLFPLMVIGRHREPQVPHQALYCASSFGNQKKYLSNEELSTIQIYSQQPWSPSPPLPTTLLLVPTSRHSPPGTLAYLYAMHPSDRPPRMQCAPQLSLIASRNRVLILTTPVDFQSPP